MRKNIVTVSIALLMALYSSAVCAQDDQEEDNTGVPPGMVMRRVGGRSVVVPKDLGVRKQGDAFIMEDINDYVARKIMEFENHLAKIDADLEVIHKELQESKASVQ